MPIDAFGDAELLGGQGDGTRRKDSGLVDACLNRPQGLQLEVEETEIVPGIRYRVKPAGGRFPVIGIRTDHGEETGVREDFQHGFDAPDQHQERRLPVLPLFARDDPLVHVLQEVRAHGVVQHGLDIANEKAVIKAEIPDFRSQIDCILIDLDHTRDVFDIDFFDLPSSTRKSAENG